MNRSRKRTAELTDWSHVCKLLAKNYFSVLRHEGNLELQFELLGQCLAGQPVEVINVLAKCEVGKLFKLLEPYRFFPDNMAKRLLAFLPEEVEEIKDHFVVKEGLVLVA